MCRDMVAATIVILCGIPASGKSSLLNELVKEFSDGKHTIIPVPYDDILPSELEAAIVKALKLDDEAVVTSKSVQRSDKDETLTMTPEHASAAESIAGNEHVAEAFLGKEVLTWKEYRKAILQCVDNLFCDLLKRERKPLDTKGEICAKFSQAVNIPTADFAEKLVVVIDDNMYLPSMRYEYYQLARRHGIGFCQIGVCCSLQEAIARNRKRQESVPEDVIREMVEKILLPDPSIHSWEKFSVVVDSSCPSLSVIKDLVRESFENPVPALPEIDKEAADIDRNINLTNLLHNADKILRKLVSEQLHEAKSDSMEKSEIKLLAQKSNIRRQEILELIKYNKVDVPTSVRSELLVAETDFKELTSFLRTLFFEIRMLNV